MIQIVTEIVFVLEMYFFNQPIYIKLRAIVSIGESKEVFYGIIEMVHLIYAQH